MNKQHHYALTVTWTGNTGNGTESYTSYQRSHTIRAGDKVELEGSSDPSFRGDRAKYNPEELFLSSLSGCHMLWYLSLCAVAGVIVVSYIDKAEGTMVETKEGGGHFSSVILHPEVTVADESMLEKSQALHQEANKFCFIANSCNFPVQHKAISKVA